MDECEVCTGENGPPVGDVTFDVDGNTVTVQFCRPCLTAVFRAMADQWNQAIDHQNTTVDAVKMMFGIDQAPTEGAARINETLNLDSLDRREGRADE